MLKKILILTIAFCFLTPAIINAEMAPQFKDSSTGKEDLSKSAPQCNKIHKNKKVMENNSANKKKCIMEKNPAMKSKEVMEHNPAMKNQKVME